MGNISNAERKRRIRACAEAGPAPTFNYWGSVWCRRCNYQMGIHPNVKGMQMTIEAGVVLDLEGKPIFWHLPPGRTGGSLPDSSELWDVLWENRRRLSGFAHSHPGAGEPGPSYTDVTTFQAIESALGRRIDWWITSSDHVALFRWVGPDKYSYQGILMRTEPDWANRLRELSQPPTKDGKETES